MFLIPYDYDSDSDEELDRRQNKFKFPWESEDQYRDTRFHAQYLFLPSDTGEPGAYERAGYQTDPGKFRKNVKWMIDKDYRPHYKGDIAHVGHIFAGQNGGSHTLNNVYMQEGKFNMAIQHRADELNAAMVGFDRTRRAMADSRRYGDLNNGPWKDFDSDQVVQLGREEWASVGVLCKKNGKKKNL
eukprot:scaffold20984_cov101-Isochrysis_galbana.AAC.1